MTLLDNWLVEAIAFILGGGIVITMVCWFIDQFNKDE